MTNTAKQRIIDSEYVIQAKEWKSGRLDRTYLTLRGFDHTFSGCITTKVYWNNNSDKLVIDIGKGMRPSEYNESIEAIKAM